MATVTALAAALTSQRGLVTRRRPLARALGAVGALLALAAPVAAGVNAATVASTSVSAANSFPGSSNSPTSPTSPASPGGSPPSSSAAAAPALAAASVNALRLPERMPLPVPGASPQPCRLRGVEHGALCGSVLRALDPTRPAAAAAAAADAPVQIRIHYAVLPALARNKLPDPVFFFAGGPGQSAIDLAGSIAAQLARFGTRRDIVLIDQRGTGRSAPLVCADDDVPTRPLAESVDPAAQTARIARCRAHLQTLPWGDLRQFTTAIATQDIDAVRRALGAARIDIVGVSYGTRVALDFMRQFPAAVRRAVIDGVAPPDMALPAAFSPDAQAAFDALLLSCEADAHCSGRYPRLRAQWRSLLHSLPRQVLVTHPLSGVAEQLVVTRDTLVGLLRLPLYAPLLASALPFAIGEASDGRFTPIVGLAATLSAGPRQTLAQGMHFAVVCAEDVPLLARSADRPGPDFGDGFAALYRNVCADWPRAVVPPAFYTLPLAPAATLVLSGGIDPATPPRHGERVARALGAKARHVVVANAGHGVMAIGCIRDVVFRFVDAATDADALLVDAGCAAGIPRPTAFVPVVGAAAAANGATR